MLGTRQPTAKFLVATAMPNCRVAGSRAMRDQVMGLSPPRRVALHAARIGCRLAALAVARGSRQAALGPVRTNLELVPALLELILGRLRHAALDHQHARTSGTRPERGEEMLGVPGRRIDRFLQVHPRVDVAQEKLGDPLVLLIAAGRAPGQIRLAIA